MHESVIIGGGIVGLATAMDIGKKHPKARVLVLEKEPDVAILGTQWLTLMFRQKIWKAYERKPFIPDSIAFILPATSFVE
ncbi:MAG TPA: FAD-dependent oxidoreductase [Pyrinomonadaceae bacterium]